MAFPDEIADLYATHGPRHLLPFIGASYRDSTSTTFRLAVVGLNAYISEGDWPDDDDELREWYHGWWAAAGHGNTHRFYHAAYAEADALARALAGESALFQGRTYEGNRRSKPELYATNAVKSFLGEQFKRSDALTPDHFRTGAPTWHAELDAMAKHDVLPSLIVVYGSQAWPMMWQSLWPGHATFKHLRITNYETCGSEGEPTYHHANLVTVELIGGRVHNVALVRLSHPSARSREPRRAAWLLRQPTFRTLARLPCAEPAAIVT